VTNRQLLLFNKVTYCLRHHQQHHAGSLACLLACALQQNNNNHIWPPGKARNYCSKSVAVDNGLNYLFHMNYALFINIGKMW